MDLIIDIDQFRCPITKDIFKDPVIADDGMVYEKDAIEEWLSKNSASPMTQIKMTNILVGCHTIKSLTDDLIKKYPELKGQQYAMPIEKIIELGNYDELLSYAEFDLKHLMDSQHLRDSDVFHKLCQNANPDILKYVIDNSIDLECRNNIDSRPIHYICKYSTPEMIKYIIDKGVDLECQQINGCRPIHYICIYSTFEMIKYIIDKGVDLECQQISDWRPLHCICKYSNSDAIEYIISKGVNLKCRVSEYKGEKADYDFIKLIELNDRIEPTERNKLIAKYTDYTSLKIFSFVVISALSISLILWAMS